MLDPAAAMEYSNESFGLLDVKPINWSNIELLNSSSTMESEYNRSASLHEPDASQTAIILVSALSWVIEILGMIGNLLVIYVVLVDPKMRRSVTNLFILNLAVSDFLILAIGVPDIVQFMLNRGWLLGLIPCKMHRYIMVASVYASIMTLTAVCIERYIAIVHPIKAHIFCSRRRILIAIAIIWPTALALAMPVMLFNQLGLRPGTTFQYCIMRFPSNHNLVYSTIKTIEFVIFFLAPVASQLVLYSIVSRRLFSSSKNLHRKQTIRQDGIEKEKDADAIRARKGVVKMLIATVTVYFLSYAPVQFPLFYNFFSVRQFKVSWSFHVLVMTLGFINSAVNPILYSIFSQNFRRKFKRVLCSCHNDRERFKYKRSMSTTMDSYGSHITRFTSMRLTSTVSEM